MQSVSSVSRPLAYRIRHIGVVPEYSGRLPTCSRQASGAVACLHTHFAGGPSS